MTQRRDTLERIAAALDRLAPARLPPHDWISAPAYIWDGAQAQTVTHLNALPLDALRGVDAQKSAFCTNVERLAHGVAAHDALLWGARGMGKSALVRAAIAHIQAQPNAAIALVQVPAAALSTVPDLVAQLGQIERRFLLFIDDLGFAPDEKAEMLSLRSLLEGAIVPRPPSIGFVVTSNRRAIVPRDAHEAEALHERDARDDALALADRFGLTLGFHPCDKKTYLEMIRVYTDPLELTVDEEEALAWAIERGTRSGRTAYQFATELAGRAQRSL